MKSTEKIIKNKRGGFYDYNKTQKGGHPSALMFSLTGASAYAQAPGIAGSQNGMSQSSMIDVKSGQATGKVGEITDKTDKAANEEPAVMVQQSQQTVAVGDASLYLSSNDDSAIEAQVGKTITSVDFEGIPEEVKANLLL